MGTSKTGITGTSQNSFSIGDGVDGYKYLYAEIANGILPGIRYNFDETQWEYSNDGAGWNDFGAGGGGSLPVGSTNQLIQNSGGLWTAVNQITLPEGTTRTIKLADSTSGSGDILIIRGANAVAGGDGGDIRLYAGNSDTAGTAGGIIIEGGDADAGSVVEGGIVSISGGAGDAGDGGHVVISGGGSNSGEQGYINLSGITRIDGPAGINSDDYLSSLPTMDAGTFVITTTEGIERGISLQQASANTTSSLLQFRKYRGTPASLAATQNGDSLGTIWFAGFDGTALRVPVKIEAKSDGVIALGSIPSKLTIGVGNDSTPPDSVVISNVNDNYSLVTLKANLYFEEGIRDWEIKVNETAENAGYGLTISSGIGAVTDGSLYLNKGSSSYVGLVETDGVTIFQDNIYFDDAVSPVITQLTTGGAAATGANLIIRAQSEANGATTGGDVQIKSGNGNSADGVVSFWSGNSRELAEIRFVDSIIDYGRFMWHKDVPLPTFTQDNEDTEITAAHMFVAAQSISTDTGVAGNLYLTAGGGILNNTSGGHLVLGAGGKTGTGTLGNIALFDEPASWETGENIIFIKNGTTAPTGNPVGGGYLYVTAGALYWRGSGGTVTPIALA